MNEFKSDIILLEPQGLGILLGTAVAVHTTKNLARVSFERRCQQQRRGVYSVEVRRFSNCVRPVTTRPRRNEKYSMHAFASDAGPSEGLRRHCQVLIPINDRWRRVRIHQLTLGHFTRPPGRLADFDRSQRLSEAVTVDLPAQYSSPTFQALRFTGKRRHCSCRSDDRSDPQH
jgi:hypothetical protein